MLSTPRQGEKTQTEDEYMAMSDKGGDSDTFQTCLEMENQGRYLSVGKKGTQTKKQGGRYHEIQLQKTSVKLGKKKRETQTTNKIMPGTRKKGKSGRV